MKSKAFTVFQKHTTMGKPKKKIDKLQKDVKPLKKEDMKKIVGGKKGKNDKWKNGCGGILPQ